MSSAIIHIREGKIQNPKILRRLFDDLKDGKYFIDAKNINKRSLNQNAYLHGVLIPEFRKALNLVGYDEVKTDEQAKLIMKSMFLKSYTVNHNTGETIEFIKDTHELTTIEMMTLVDEVIKFCAENMSYQIPYPGEALKINYQD